MSENQDGILQYVKSQGGRPVHAVEIQSHLRIGKKYASEFRRELRFLVKQGLLKRGKKRTFQIPPHTAGKGRLSVARDGYGFVALEENDGPDVFIPARNLGGPRPLEGSRRPPQNPLERLRLNTVVDGFVRVRAVNQLSKTTSSS